MIFAILLKDETPCGFSLNQLKGTRVLSKWILYPWILPGNGDLPTTSQAYRRLTQHFVRVMARLTNHFSDLPNRSPLSAPSDERLALADAALGGLQSRRALGAELRPQRPQR